MKRVLAALLAVVLFTLTGCATPKVQDNKKVIAASFYPVYIFTLNLCHGIEDVQVVCMAEQVVGCLHDYTITARDAKIADDADAFVISGGGMEAFVEDLYKTSEDLYVIDSSTGIEFICSGDHSHEEEDEHSHEHNHGHSHEHNSHIWMSVENAKKQVLNIKNGLSEKFPEYKEQLLKNYTDYMKRLDKLSQRMESAKKEVNHAPVATFHDAYVYLAREIDLNIVCTIENGEGGEPSAKELAHLSGEISNHGIKALFIEPEYEGSAANILASETDAQVFVLNPVTSGEAKLTAYEDIMNSNIDIILKAVK